MKLLSPTEARDKAKKTIEGEKHLLASIESLITQKRNELSEAEASFDVALQKQRNLWAAERQEHENVIVALKKEAEELEERKRQALLPLTAKAEELDTKASALDAREVELDQRAAGIEQDKQLLAERLDEVAEREMQADKVAKGLTLREQGVQEQAAQVVSGSTRLTLAIELAGKEAAERERAVGLREAAIKGREYSLEERERKVEATEKGFAARELLIKDRSEKLKREFDELTQKQHG